jgi:hypothetical protein
MKMQELLYPSLKDARDFVSGLKKDARVFVKTRCLSMSYARAFALENGWRCEMPEFLH